MIEGEVLVADHRNRDEDQSESDDLFPQRNSLSR